MTAMITPERTQARSKNRRRLRRVASASWVTLFASALCLLFILPLIYMLTAALGDFRTPSINGAPLYPAIARTYQCPNDKALCSYYDTQHFDNAIRYEDAPAPGDALGSVTSTEANAYSSVDVASVISGRGDISVAVTTTSPTPLTFGSREGSNPPQLVISYCGQATETNPPTVPAGLSATPKSKSQINLAWTASTDDTAVAGYKIYRDGVYLVRASSNSWWDTGVPGGTHSYQVAAVDASGNESARSESVSATVSGGVVSDSGTPPPPTKVKATATAWNSVTVTWTASTDSTVASYEVRRNGTAVGWVSGDVTTFIDVTTEASTQYEYTVIGYRPSHNPSTFSDPAKATTPASSACVTPTSFPPLAPKADSYVSEANPKTNYGAESTLVVSGAPGASQTAYLIFDISTVPQGQITSAVLRLYSTTASSTGYVVNAVSTANWSEVFDVVTATTDKSNQALKLYIVPTAEGPRTLALLQEQDRSTGKPSIFIDPATKERVVAVVDVDALSRVWEFHVSLDNFGSAFRIADDFTSGNVSDSSLGGMFVGNGFARLFFNTGVIAVLGTIGATLSAIIVAYGFARFRFPGRDVLFLVLIGTILLPLQVTLIPQFIIFNAIGWTGTWLPLIVPHYFANAYNVFLLRQYFLTLPRELDEAAMMDGASPFRILRSVIIPQSWPAIAAVILFHFFFAWNDFLAPLIYLSGKPDLFPIAVGLNNFNTQYRTAEGPAVIQSGALIALIIPVVIFFLAQRVFMRGVVISGVEK